MNYFHLEAKVVSRGAGRSVIAAAAYASCSRLYNDYDGLTHDYTRKQGCLYSEVFLPQYAPAEWKDRQLLWEAVESVEKTKDSRLAREFVVALPSELSLDDWKNMLERFVHEQGIDLGMCADVNIHDPYPPGHNPHSHILFTMRPLDEHGKWQAKTQKEYLCKRGSEERGFTADEFKVSKTQGWEKQYMYQFGEKKEYLTPSEAEKIEGCIRTSKTPKSTRYGRQNPLTERWNSEEQIFAWRKSWETIINEEQARHGIADRVDCRSHAARGLSEQPTVHEGYHARKLESMGIVSGRCELNRQIKADNKLLRELKKQVQKLMKAVKENIPAIASALETLRDHMVLIQYQLIMNISQQEAVVFQKNLLADILAEYKNVKSEIKAKTAEKKELIAEQKNCGIHFIRAGKLGEQIATLTEDIEELKFRKAQLLARLNCQDNGVAAKKQALKDMDTTLDTLVQQHTLLSGQKEANKAEFLEIRDGIAPENKGAVMQKREALRPEGMVGMIRKLYEKYRDKYSSDTFDEANRQIDAELKEQPIHKKKRSINEQLKTPEQVVPQSKKQNKKEYER
ncbi:MobQ family relaxase [Holdemania sp. Marseille-P2844]|uniref:MobQ family relaxase n=1 Tax=Holdemania sp. Marseille-P2844 TaxID=1852366 RepID=UPI00093416F8|nr:MobQ family relaxase [Holdemania sp. Marseille-P2844]